MSSQLTSQDRQRLLRGITKKVGQKPYEVGLYGQQTDRDYVLVELYDALGNLIEYRDLNTITANLDIETESSILDATDALLDYQTSVVIAHRLETILNAEKILVMSV